MLFSEIIGQDTVKSQLIQQLRTGRVPHAQLFYGPPGCGKLPMALAYATALLCQHPVGGEACGNCQGCRMTEKLEHPDLHFVFPIIQNKKYCDDFIKEWRDLLLETPYFDAKTWYERLGVTTQQPRIYVHESDRILHKISLSSSQGGYRVMIIWHPEQMMQQAANKLLKILEEPTHGTAFILVSDRPDLLLDTIISRCVRQEFKALPPEVIVDMLVTQYGLSLADATQVARGAAGSVTMARTQVTTSGEEELFLDMFKLLMRKGFSRQVKDLQTWSETVAGWGREKQRRFLSYMQHLIRESFVRNLAMPEICYTNRNESDFLGRFSPYVNERNVEDFVKEIDMAIRDISQNGNAKMVFFDLALQCLVLVRK